MMSEYVSLDSDNGACLHCASFFFLKCCNDRYTVFVACSNDIYRNTTQNGTHTKKETHNSIISTVRLMSLNLSYGKLCRSLA